MGTLVVDHSLRRKRHMGACDVMGEWFGLRTVLGWVTSIDGVGPGYQGDPLSCGHPSLSPTHRLSCSVRTNTRHATTRNHRSFTRVHPYYLRGCFTGKTFQGGRGLCHDRRVFRSCHPTLVMQILTMFKNCKIDVWRW